MRSDEACSAGLRRVAACVGLVDPQIFRDLLWRHATADKFRHLFRAALFKVFHRLEGGAVSGFQPRLKRAGIIAREIRVT